MEDLPIMTDTVDMSLFLLGTLLVIFGVLTVSILFSWALYIVWFYDCSPMEALQISRKLISRNWGAFIVFVILSGLISAAGLMLCCVGLLYAVPAISAAMFYAFADATQLLHEPNDADSDIIDHFIA